MTFLRRSVKGNNRTGLRNRATEAGNSRRAAAMFFFAERKT